MWWLVILNQDSWFPSFLKGFASFTRKHGTILWCSSSFNQEQQTALKRSESRRVQLGQDIAKGFWYSFLRITAASNGKVNLCKLIYELIRLTSASLHLTSSLLTFSISAPTCETKVSIICNPIRAKRVAKVSIKQIRFANSSLPQSLKID